MSIGVDVVNGSEAGGIRKQHSGARNASTTRMTLSSWLPAIPAMSPIVSGGERRMARPRRWRDDGCKSRLARNHLGHCALTGLVLGAQLRASSPRVVTVSSGAHRMGAINFDDLQGERRYNNWRAYGQSKLANLMFCFELQRRASAAGTALASMAAHPGYAATNLQLSGPATFYERALGALGNKLIAQSAEMGALPTLYAATVRDLPGGSFVGPDGFMEQRGFPRVVKAADKAYDEGAWRRLWETSEELTGVAYDFAVATPR